METKHTPGPWSQSHRKTKDGFYSTEVYSIETGNAICTLTWYPKPPVQVVIDGVVKNEIGTYREANAKLIAAAPEMLRQLAFIVEFIGRLENPGTAWLLVKDDCESVIKKATE